VYLLAGLVRCRPCGRRIDAHWVNNRAGYRCRRGHTSAQRATPDRAKNLYVGEDHILASLPALLAALRLVDEPDTEQQGSPESGQRRDLAELMRQSNLTIICDVAGWTVETAGASDDSDERLNPTRREDRSWGNDVSETESEDFLTHSQEIYCIPGDIHVPQVSG
jgi:site-specific DNA recombinase